MCKDDGSCVDPIYLCTKNGWDRCYNEAAFAAHNEKRKLHCADDLTLDPDMASKMQELLNAKQSVTLAADRGEYNLCLESFYEAPADKTNEEVMNTNLATDYWYAKKSAYDFDAGEGSPQADAEIFTRMVWDISAGKVAFARRGKFVMAWYCPGGSAGINAGDPAAFKAAVKKDTCNDGKKCEADVAGDQYNKCYQADALAAHNDKREAHKVPDLDTDIDVAR